MKTILRYPGGKSRLAPFITRLIPQDTSNYLEPFAGGASVAFLFASINRYARITLCDKNHRIANLLRAISNIDTAAKLAEQIMSFTCTIENYEAAKLCDDPLSVLVVNRCSFGGRGGGAIGGADQSGKWKVDARWNGPALAKTCLDIAALLHSRCTVLCDDGIALCEHFDGFIYADPPYFAAGPSLYSTPFEHDDHARLKSALSNRSGWVLSYDHAARSFWADANVSFLDVNITRNVHSGGGQKQSELVILPNHD